MLGFFKIDESYVVEGDDENTTGEEGEVEVVSEKPEIPEKPEGIEKPKSPEKPETNEKTNSADGKNENLEQTNTSNEQNPQGEKEESLKNLVDKCKYKSVVVIGDYLAVDKTHLTQKGVAAMLKVIFKALSS